VDPPAVIESALATVRPAADAKQIQVITALDPRVPQVYGDAARLQQVIWNLLTNAIKFTPRGGRVAVALRQADSQVEVEVRDNGKGISPEFLPHVFDKFRQADASAAREHGGLGLGLALVKTLMETHGGSVHVSSPGEGQGATFAIRLPVPALRGVDNRDGDAQSRILHSSGLPTLSSLKVLVVDDEPDARELVRRLLEDCGARVLTASAAHEALDCLTATRWTCW
jgi:K+-sensing histidine kinase KdpD